MKTFKQFIQPTDVLIAEGMYDDLKGAVGNALETGAKKTLEFKKNAGAATKAFMGDAESTLGKVGTTMWELIDPSGISSYDDAAEALLTYRKNPSTLNWALYLLNVFNCIPNIPLLISLGATVAGAAAGGVGAIPGAVASGTSLLGGVAARGGVKLLIKKAAKDPEAAIKAVDALSTYVKKSPEAVEAVHKFTKELGGSADEVAKLEKVIGPAPGVKLEPTTPPKPKALTFDEYKKLSPADKSKVDAGFAKKAAEDTTKIAKEIDSDPIFKELVDKQKWYRSKEGNTDYGLDNTLKWIVSKSDDPEIARALDSIAVKNGTTREKVIDAIKAAHPSIKFPEPPVPTTAAKALKGLEDLGEVGAVGAKTSDDVAKAGEKAVDATKAGEKTAETAADVAKMSDEVADVAKGSKVGNLAKGLAAGAVTKKWTSGFALSRLLANILNPIKSYLDQAFAGVQANQTPLGTAGASPDEIVDFTTSDGKKIKTTRQAVQDVGLSPLQAPEPMVYTFGGKVLTPAQAAALGSFATPARYNSQTKKWEEIKNVIRPGQQIMNPDGSSPEEVNATPVVPYDKESRFNEFEGTPEIGAKDKEQSLRTGRIVTQNIPQGATEKNPLGREGLSASEYTKPDKFNNPPMTFDDIFKSIFGP